MYPRLTSVDAGLVWLLIRGYINHLCGETPTDLRVGMPMPTRNLAGVPVTLTETQRKAAINSPYYWTLVDSVFDPLHARFNFTLEGCADDEGLTSHGDLPHCSPSDSILERDLSVERVFINPP
jgi:hypothetical protein